MFTYIYYISIHCGLTGYRFVPFLTISVCKNSA